MKVGCIWSLNALVQRRENALLHHTEVMSLGRNVHCSCRNKQGVHLADTTGHNQYHGILWSSSMRQGSKVVELIPQAHTTSWQAILSTISKCLQDIPEQTL